MKKINAIFVQEEIVYTAKSLSCSDSGKFPYADLRIKQETDSKSSVSCLCGLLEFFIIWLGSFTSGSRTQDLQRRSF